MEHDKRIEQHQARLEVLNAKREAAGTELNAEYIAARNHMIELLDEWRNAAEDTRGQFTLKAEAAWSALADRFDTT